MKLATRNLIPSLCLAASILLASAVAASAPRALWAAAAGPLVLVLGLIAADLLAGRGQGRTRPSMSALLIAGSILLASGIVAVAGIEHVAKLLPILGACAVVPLTGHAGRRDACRVPSGGALG